MQIDRELRIILNFSHFWVSWWLLHYSHASSTQWPTHIVSLFSSSDKVCLQQMLWSSPMDHFTTLLYSYAKQSSVTPPSVDWHIDIPLPQDRLLEAMQCSSMFLTDEEVRRNSHGSCQVYSYDRHAPGRTYPSPWPTQFPDVRNCRVKWGRQYTWHHPCTCIYTAYTAYTAV